MQWGISPNAPAKEQIKADFEGIIRGLNCVGEIDYLTYSKLFDEIMPLFDKMHEQGKKDAVTWHKWPEEKPPENQFLLLSHLGENGCTFVDDGYFDSTDGGWQGRFCFICEVLAWAEMPEPYKEGN